MTAIDEQGQAQTPGQVAPVTPWIISTDTVAELEFLAAVFGTVERPGSRIMDGTSIRHVEIDLAGAAIMLFDSGPGWPATPAHTRVYVADLRTVVDTALDRGARLVSEPTEMPFGDVAARFRDPQGHLWWVHEHVEDVAVDEMTRRFGQERYAAGMDYFGRSLVDEMTS